MFVLLLVFDCVLLELVALLEEPDAGVVVLCVLDSDCFVLVELPELVAGAVVREFDLLSDGLTFEEPLLFAGLLCLVLVPDLF